MKLRFTNLDLRALASASAVALCPLVCACTSINGQSISGCKDRTKIEGFRYVLPRPLIVVRPDAEHEGMWKTTIEYVPDLDRQFAVSACNILSSNTFKISTSGGILTKIELDAKADAVAKAMIDATGAVGAAGIQASAANASNPGAKSEGAQPTPTTRSLMAVTPTPVPTSTPDKKKPGQTPTPTPAPTPTPINPIPSYTKATMAGPVIYAIEMGPDSCGKQPTLALIPFKKWAGGDFQQEFSPVPLYNAPPPPPKKDDGGGK